jgi:beta-ureidopropionase / N-carbamoyl-L-amino-acid hydrolase
MFARRPGKNPSLPPIVTGSHLDTQPNGGKFDGVLGALEAVRTLQEAGYETNAPIEIVNSTNEEGARFAPPMLASGVFAGVVGLAALKGDRSRDAARRTIEKGFCHR